MKALGVTPQTPLSPRRDGVRRTCNRQHPRPVLLSAAPQHHQRWVPFPHRASWSSGASSSSNAPQRRSKRVVMASAVIEDDAKPRGGDIGRRALLSGVAGAAGAGLISNSGTGWSHCRCGGCAYAMAPLVDVPVDKRLAFDPERNAQQDVMFARGMNSGMGGYEQAIAGRKRALFSEVFSRLPTDTEVTVVEVGMGTFPNAPYYFDPAVHGGIRRRIDLVGVDPNDAMELFARDNLARVAGAPSTSASALVPGEPSLRIVHGVAEALPLRTHSADAVVCTLTLCSVLDPVAAVAEIKRVLKPGAPLLFIEHVLSEDDAGLAAQQVRFNGLQMAMADGCHLDRKTLDVVNAAGFASVQAERFNLPGFGLISSQVAGIAVA